MEGDVQATSYRTSGPQQNGRAIFDFHAFDLSRGMQPRAQAIANSHATRSISACKSGPSAQSSNAWR
jgi:hypothetical protein